MGNRVRARAGAGRTQNEGLRGPQVSANMDTAPPTVPARRCAGVSGAGQASRRVKNRVAAVPTASSQPHRTSDPVQGVNTVSAPGR
ncbi:hypothetical protein GCM10009603_26900 [Nocardiopsis exhalans]